LHCGNVPLLPSLVRAKPNSQRTLSAATRASSGSKTMGRFAVMLNETRRLRDVCSVRGACRGWPELWSDPASADCSIVGGDATAGWAPGAGDVAGGCVSAVSLVSSRRLWGSGSGGPRVLVHEVWLHLFGDLRVSDLPGCAALWQGGGYRLLEGADPGGVACGSTC
jgi:hypothetical protein